MSVLSLSGLSVLMLATLGCGGITQPLGDVAGGSTNDSNKSSQAGEPGSHSNGGAGSAQGTGAAAGATGSASPCESACFEKIRTGSPASCKLCHTSRATVAGGLQSSGLDLESPNVTARLKDIPAKHADITSADFPGPACPMGDKLVDTAAPEQSWLLKKIKGEQGTCGDRMPQTNSLRADEIACVEQYVYCVAGQVPPP